MNIVNVYIYGIILSLISILLIFTNCGGTYYSLYATSLESINHKKLMFIKSILCNKTFDYGHQQKRYKLLHIIASILFLFTLYLDLNYFGIYYIVSLFLILSIIDRLYFLRFNKNKIICSTDLNIIPIDHQFKLLFVNNFKNQMFIEPGDTFYISSSYFSSFSRPSVFFSKNNLNSIGCIMRVHRNNTLSVNMERVKWNFNFLEKILDNEIKPIFRGPYRNNNIYNRLIRNIYNKDVFMKNKRYIQYLIAVDEGISYQIEYLTYLQYHNYIKMPFPTHIIFATTSKSLFNYICTNLQLLFIEIEDLTVECKLLPSNINLIPNVDEMINYYKKEKIKEKEKKKKEREKQKEFQEEEKYDDDDDDNDDITIHQITENNIMKEMEYDILNYLSIPHILYHHNLKNYYENHKNSKLSNKLNKKYNLHQQSEINNNNNSRESSSKNKNNASIIPDIESSYNFNEDIQIEMYYSGIPFISNVLNNVCTICRIPYYTQKIY